jgi:hypothetical protein
MSGASHLLQQSPAQTGAPANWTLLKSVAVDSDVRGSGVGTAVSSAVVQAMFGTGATNVVSVGWTDGEGCHIRGPLETLGFKSRGDLEDFWYEDSLREGYSCPTCGRTWCSERIFVLPLYPRRQLRGM